MKRNTSGWLQTQSLEYVQQVDHNIDRWVREIILDEIEFPNCTVTSCISTNHKIVENLNIALEKKMVTETLTF